MPALGPPPTRVPGAQRPPLSAGRLPYSPARSSICTHLTQAKPRHRETRLIVPEEAACWPGQGLNHPGTLSQGGSPGQPPNSDPEWPSEEEEEALLKMQEATCA